MCIYIYISLCGIDCVQIPMVTTADKLEIFSDKNTAATTLIIIIHCISAAKNGENNCDDCPGCHKYNRTDIFKK